MVVGAFPIAKLSVLLVKQISKPIANMCKERAKNNPFFRTYVCMPPAQFYNWCEVKAKMWILNLGKPVNIPVLSQEMAIELGANLLGETVIFVIGAGLLIIEYNRQSKKEAAKEAKREEDLKHFTNTITELYFSVQQQQTQLRELERIVHSISGKKPTAPPPVIKEPPGPPPSLAGSGHDETKPEESKPKKTPDNSEKGCNDKHKISLTPYPNKGVILQSLNYIQMDVLSSFFPNSQIVERKVSNEKPVSYRREPALLSVALNNIENNFRSLF